jgi:hypothetical protein
MVKSIEINNLSEDNINRVEEGIISGLLQPNENNYMISVSYRYYDFAKLAYKEIQKTYIPNTSYIHFAENSFGYQSYGFYKSRDGNIYIIDTYLENIQNIFTVDENILFLQNI